MDKKKLRSENWTLAEKNLLIECVNERTSMIENKSNDIKCLRTKREAWLEIAKIFEENGYPRDVDRMKEQWRRMKCTAKKNVSISEQEKKINEEESLPEDPLKMDYTIKNICLKMDTCTSQPAQKNKISPQKARKLFRDKVHLNGRKKCLQKSEKMIYENDLLLMNKEKHELDLRHRIEIHNETMAQLLIEKQRKEEELETAKIKRKKEELELLLMEKRIKLNDC